MTTRRHVLSAAAAALAAPLALRAQAQKRLPVVGFLFPHNQRSPEQGASQTMLSRLRELGWEQGKTVNYEQAYAEGQMDRLPALAAALVAKKVDVIVTIGSAGARAAKQATATIPIVTSGPDLVALGLAASLARPGGNITGMKVAADGLSSKRLETIKLAVPAAKRVAVLRSGSQLQQGPGAAAAARTLGVELSLMHADTDAEFDAAFAEMSRNRPDAIWCADNPASVARRARIIEFAARERLPALYPFRQFTDSGGLMSYGVDIDEFDRRMMLYVDKILRGAKPGELPIEQPTKFELVVNLKTARALGLELPQALLVSADRVIE